MIFWILSGWWHLGQHSFPILLSTEKCTWLYLLNGIVRDLRSILGQNNTWNLSSSFLNRVFRCEYFIRGAFIFDLFLSQASGSISTTWPRSALYFYSTSYVFASADGSNFTTCKHEAKVNPLFKIYVCESQLVIYALQLHFTSHRQERLL